MLSRRKFQEVSVRTKKKAIKGQLIDVQMAVSIVQSCDWTFVIGHSRDHTPIYVTQRREEDQSRRRTLL